MEKMPLPIEKAVILAAGRGTRMKSLTDDCPKPMLPLNGRPMLAHQIERLEAAGIAKICIVVGYKAEMVREYFAAHPPRTASLRYELQATPDGTGSAARLAKDFAAGEPFLLTFGDIMVDAAVYARLFALAGGAEIVLTVKRVEDPYRGAAVYVDGGRVVKIVEKPPKGSSTTNFNNAGIYIFGPRVFEKLARLQPSARGEYDLTDAIQETAAAGETVRWLEIEGFWRDVGRPEDLTPAGAFVAG